MQEIQDSIPGLSTVNIHVLFLTRSTSTCPNHFSQSTFLHYLTLNSYQLHSHHSKRSHLSTLPRIINFSIHGLRRKTGEIERRLPCRMLTSLTTVPLLPSVNFMLAVTLQCCTTFSPQDNR